MNDASQELGGVDTSRLKHGTGRNAHIVLVPQPSDDPNDPLNWPQWKKEMIIILVSGAALMATAVYCTILPATLILAGYFDQSITEVSNSTGAHVMAIGCVTFFTSAAAKKWGKRPVFLLSVLVMTVASIWIAASKSWGSYFAARVVQGMGVAPVETLVTAMIGGTPLQTTF
jgi:MFS family permease